MLPKVLIFVVFLLINIFMVHGGGPVFIQRFKDLPPIVKMENPQTPNRGCEEDYGAL